ncbi:thiamine pyrophosphate-dependent enzyme [Gemmobacter lanyuensis]
MQKQSCSYPEHFIHPHAVKQIFLHRKSNKLKIRPKIPICEKRSVGRKSGLVRTKPQTLQMFINCTKVSTGAAMTSRPNLATETLLEMQRRMLRIRLFDERASKMVKRGYIPGTVHTSIGQEAQVVGACMALRPGDHMSGNHRSHGHPIGMGSPLGPLMAELVGKATGVCKGKGGSLHLADYAVGSLGSPGSPGRRSRLRSEQGCRRRCWAKIVWPSAFSAMGRRIRACFMNR